MQGLSENLTLIENDLDNFKEDTSKRLSDIYVQFFPYIESVGVPGIIFYNKNGWDIEHLGNDGETITTESKTEITIPFPHALTDNDTIFSDTVKENIIFGREVSEEDLNKAIKVSQSYEFISKLPDNLETWLTAKGTNISGGQKQRLFIARALANNPRILILDDSSSALDYKTDSLLRKEIKENYNCTMVIVAQRISSIKHCDLILVLEDGKIVGKGNHEFLMQNSPIYNEIYQSQMGGGINE